MSARVYRRPRRSPRNAGRFPRRSGAATSGKLGNWMNSIVGQCISEAEKRRIADRALDLYTNDGMAHGILESMTSEGVGIGLTPQLSPDADWLGMPTEWVQNFQSQGEKLFERWGLDFRCFCDAQHRLNFYGLQALAYFHWKLDGLAVFQVLYDNSAHSPLPISLLPVDAFRLGTPLSYSGAEICDGVELDTNGAPVAVHVRRSGAALSASTADAFNRLELTDRATGLPKVLLVGDVRNIAEYRQDSILSCMIPELRNNQEFVEAALVRTLLANMFAVKLHHSGQPGASSSLDPEDRFEELQQGMILHLFGNEDAQFIASDAPGPNFATMFDSIVKRLGMATGRGAENVAREYKASYSASQANMIQTDKIVRSEQELVLNTRFNAPALAWMLYAGAMRGLVPVKSMKHMRENLFDYCRAEWLPQPTRHIDPLKTANAHKVEKSIGERTIRESCSEKNQNWKEHVGHVAEEMSFVREREKALDLPEGSLMSRFFPVSSSAVVSEQQNNSSEGTNEDA